MQKEDEVANKEDPGGSVLKTNIVPLRQVMLQSPAGIKDNICNQLRTQG